MAEELTWIAGDASTFTLYSAASTSRTVPTIEGMGLPTLDHQAQPYPFLHGAMDIARRFRDRTAMIGFQQMFTTRAAWQTGRESLRNVLNPDLGKGQLKYVDPNAVDWRLDAWIVNAPMPRGKLRDGILETVIELWAPWPFWRKATAETDTDDFNDANNVDIAISNDGNMPTIPSTIVLAAGAGEQIKNPVLTIVGTGAKIDLDHTIAATETVTITCFPPEDVAVTKDGTSILGDLSYDSVLVGFEIPRGNQVVRIVGEATSDGNCLITFNEWFLAV